MAILIYALKFPLQKDFARRLVTFRPLEGEAEGTRYALVGLDDQDQQNREWFHRAFHTRGSHELATTFPTEAMVTLGQCLSRQKECHSAALRRLECQMLAQDWYSDYSDSAAVQRSGAAAYAALVAAAKALQATADGAEIELLIRNAVPADYQGGFRRALGS